MWLMILCFAAIILIAMLPVVAIVQKRRCVKAKRKTESALRGIEAGICQRLHAACPNSKWRWACRPASFAENGGIARIEVIQPSDNRQFMDVCLSASGFMALHVLDVAELKASDSEATTVENFSPAPETFAPIAWQNFGGKPNDEESVGKWYNIVLKSTLFTLIENLNAKNEICLNIGQDGKAYTEGNGENAVVFDFGEMPDVSLWEYITEMLGDEGLFAEVQNDNRIFISWA